MQVRYVGLFDEVIVPEISATETVKRGISIQADDALAERLFAQPSNWEAVSEPKPPKGKE